MKNDNNFIDKKEKVLEINTNDKLMITQTVNIHDNEGLQQQNEVFIETENIDNKKFELDTDNKLPEQLNDQNTKNLNT